MSIGGFFRNQRGVIINVDSNLLDLDGSYRTTIETRYNSINSKWHRSFKVDVP